MNDYEILLDECFKENIVVVEKNFKSKAKGLWKNKKIGISKKLVTNTQKKCVLVEEMGHYKTTTGDITDQTKIENRKQELIARRWGHEHIVTLFGLIEAFEYGASSSHEISEFLEVTEEYLDECIEDYRRKYGVYFMLEQYCIYFEPNLQIGRSFNPSVKK